MSGNLAHTLPVDIAGLDGGERHRHIEVVPSRAQRRARPKLAYAVTAVVGMVVVLLGQLGLSIVLADGAYEISTLNSQQTQLGRTEDALSEQLNVLSSPQHLADEAAALGMVTNATPVFLDLASGSVLGTPVAAAGSPVSQEFLSSLTPNSLLSGVPVGAGQAAAEQEAVDQAAAQQATAEAAAAQQAAAAAEQAAVDEAASGAGPAAVDTEDGSAAQNAGTPPGTTLPAPETR